MADLPHRTWTMKLSIGADTEAEMEKALHQILTEWSMGYLRSDFASGGPASGWSGETKHDPSVTHESYFKAIDAWRASENKEAPRGED